MLWGAVERQIAPRLTYSTAAAQPQVGLFTLHYSASHTAGLHAYFHVDLMCFRVFWHVASNEVFSQTLQIIDRSTFFKKKEIHVIFINYLFLIIYFKMYCWL